MRDALTTFPATTCAVSTATATSKAIDMIAACSLKDGPHYLRGVILPSVANKTSGILVEIQTSNTDTNASYATVASFIVKADANREAVFPFVLEHERYLRFRFTANDNACTIQSWLEFGA